MEKRYRVVSIRYNTKSDGCNQCWRVIADDVEYLTDKVVVNGKLETTKDWMGEGWGHRHHVTIKNAIVDYSIDYTLIRNDEKTLFKDIFKTITYRILGTSVTFGIGYISTGSMQVGVTLGFADLILKPIIYFIHERLWRVSKGE